MRTVKDYKELFELFPDDTPVIIGDNYNCDITGFSFSTADEIIHLEVTEGYGIIENSFVDKIFSLIPHGDNQDKHSTNP